MMPRRRSPVQFPRELLLDGVAVALAALLVLLLATGLNRLPYPGTQPFAGRQVLTMPSAPPAPDLSPEGESQASE